MIHTVDCRYDFFVQATQLVANSQANLAHVCMHARLAEVELSVYVLLLSCVHN